MSKTILIGPASPPVRGGIAIHTTNFHKSFNKINRLGFIGLRKLYPEFLYPGNSQFTDIYKFKNKYFNLINIKDLIKIFNFVSKSNKVILTYWTFFHIPFFLLITMFNKNKVILLCHNVYDHDSKFFKRLLIRFFLKRFDNFIVHTTNDKKKIIKFHNSANILRLSHPLYDNSSIQYNLILEKNIKLLFFGIIRPYKGLDFFLDVFNSLKRKDIELKIIGEIWYKDRKYWEDIISKSNKKILYEFNFVSNSKLEKEIIKSNLIIMPYMSNTGSGVASMALKYNRPIIGSSIEGITEIFLHNKNALIFKLGSKSSLKSVLNRLNKEKILRMSNELNKMKKIHNMENYAKKINAKFF
ncbi:glycosyltransferase [Candidatus Pelagibacter sp.]|uniref:glycosyltransferase n=1 Tax=Candidatus Pelagibacter sp. TaxID=2024849 RepID=UPI003D0AF83B